MALLDIFKKRKKPALVKTTKGKEERKKEKPAFVKTTKDKKEKVSPSLSSMVLKAAHVTEKAGDLVEKNQYIFKVYPRANKIKVKKAVEDVFKINVISVKIINVAKKKRRLGKISGWRKGYKKAIVGIKKGQKIDILPR